MARNGTYSKNIEAYFRENPNRPVSVTKLGTIAKCRPTAVSAAISYLNRRHREGKGGLPIETIRRGKSWGYYPAEQQKPVSKPQPTTTTTNQAPEFLERVTVRVPGWAEAEQAFNRDQTHQVIRLVLVGTTTEGHNIGKDEDTGNVFKVVPL